MTTDPELDEVDAGGADSPEPVASDPAIESQESDDGLTLISTTPMYRTRHRDDLERW